MTISWCQYMRFGPSCPRKLYTTFTPQVFFEGIPKFCFSVDFKKYFNMVPGVPVIENSTKNATKNKMNSLCRISLYVIFWFCLLTVLKPPFLIKLCPCFLNLVFGLTCISICLFACLSNCFLNLSFLYSPLQVQIQLRSHGISLPYLLQWRMFRE